LKRKSERSEIVDREVVKELRKVDREVEKELKEVVEWEVGNLREENNDQGILRIDISKGEV
jgi:hypothetical protein